MFGCLGSVGCSHVVRPIICSVGRVNTDSLLSTGFSFELCPMSRTPLMGHPILCSVDCVTMHTTTCPVCPDIQSLQTPRLILTTITITVTTAGINYQHNQIEQTIGMSAALPWPLLGFPLHPHSIQSRLLDLIEMALYWILDSIAVWLDLICHVFKHLSPPLIWLLRQLAWIMQLSMSDLLQIQSTIN